MPRSSQWYQKAKALTGGAPAPPRLKWWEKGDAPDPDDDRRDKGPARQERESNLDPARTIYIGDVQPYVKDEDVVKYYSQLGKRSVEYIRWEKTKKGRSSGCGWIVFRTRDAAEWALRMKPPNFGAKPAVITRYNEAPSRKRVSAMLEETRSKRQKLSEEEVKKALSVGKVLLPVQWTKEDLEKRPFQKDFSALIKYLPKPDNADLAADDALEEEDATEAQLQRVAAGPSTAVDSPAEPSDGQTAAESETQPSEQREAVDQEAVVEGGETAEEEVAIDADGEGEEDEEDEDDEEDEEDEEDEDEGDSSDGSEESVGEIETGKLLGGKYGNMVIDRVIPQEELQKEEDDERQKQEQQKQERAEKRAFWKQLMAEKAQKEEEQRRQALVEDAKRKRPLQAAEHADVEGDAVPPPVWCFEEIDFGAKVAEVLRQRFMRPSPIQCYAWPAILHGRDVIGLADTGSGKTMAYILPGLVHLKAQKRPRSGDGPIVLVLAPTRELVAQIGSEVNRFKEAVDVRVGLAYGGLEGQASRVEQGHVLSQGVDVVAATPGRLTDFVEADICRLFRVTYLVLDEADHMLDLGFAPQIKNIMSQLRPDRQTLLFSATWQREVKQLAKEVSRSSVRIIINRADELKANKSVRQEVVVVKTQDSKQEELIKVLKRVQAASPELMRTLVFVNRKKVADDLLKLLKEHQFHGARALHGDLKQGKREKVLESLRLDPHAIVIGTDVAARGIDIRNLACVVNYDLPKALDQYVHRIGRTGRAGSAGLAVSFFFPATDYLLAKRLVRVIREAGQTPPKELCGQVHRARPKECKEVKRFAKQQRVAERKFKASAGAATPAKPAKA